MAALRGLDLSADGVSAYPRLCARTESLISSDGCFRDAFGGVVGGATERKRGEFVVNFFKVDWMGDHPHQ